MAFTVPVTPPGRRKFSAQTGEVTTLTVRVAVSHHIDTAGSLSDIQASIRRVAEHPLFREKNPLLRIIGIKTYLDGGMLTGSAYLRQPWGVSEMYAITDPDYRRTVQSQKEIQQPAPERQPDGRDR